MSKAAMGIISCNYRADFLQGIAQTRPLAAIPFGGRYRLLDFPLSSMVNSGIRTVGLIIPYHSRPILDHLGGGKSWYLDRKRGGLFILPGSNNGFYVRRNKFSLQDLQKNKEFLERDRSEYVIMSAAGAIFNMDYGPILFNHAQKKADLTMVCRKIFRKPGKEVPEMILYTGPEGRVWRLEKTWGKEDESQLCFADILIMGREMLLNLILEQEDWGSVDLLDVLEQHLESFQVFAYEFTGYFGRISSVQRYFQCSMEMLQPALREELFLGADRIHTKIKDNPPTKYGPKGAVRDSLVSSGCHIQGEVERSILFREVQVEAGASIKNCILMQKCRVETGAVLENAILDKFVQVRANTILRGKEGHPILASKGSQI